MPTRRGSARIAKLSEDKQELIFALKAQGYSMKAIVKSVGASEACVANYLTGKTMRGGLRKHRPIRHHLTGRYRDIEIIRHLPEQGGYEILCHACNKTSIMPGWKIVVRRGCGCLRPKIIPGTAFRHLFASYTTIAARRGLVFELTQKEFIALNESPCFYCNKPPSNRYKARYSNEDYIYSGIDRLDSRVGYISSNCVACCRTCNFMKKELSVSEFCNKIEQIHKRLGSIRQRGAL